MLYLLLFNFLIQIYATETITWDDCVSETRVNNLQIKTAREDLSSYKYQKKALWNEYLPSVSGSLDASRGNSNTSTSNDTSSYSASLTARQNLFSGFSSLSKSQKAEANIESQSATYRSVKADVSYDLWQAFSLVLYAQDYIKLSEENIKRRKDNLDLVQLRFEGGMENKGSYLLSKAALQEAEYDQLQAQHLLQTAKQQLASVMGRKEIAEDVKITGELPLSDPEKNINIHSIVEQLPEHQAAVAKSKAYKADLRLARSYFYPSLDIMGQTSKFGSSWPLPNNQWSAMVSLSVPLFNGGRDFYSTYSADSKWSASLFEQQQTDLDLLYQLRQTYNSFLDSIEKVKVYKSFVEAAKTRAKIARSKYNTGLLSFENWDIIENDLINKEKVNIQALRDRRIAEAAWMRSQSKGVFE